MLSSSSVQEDLSLERAKREHVLAVLETCHGQRSAAAAILKVDRKTLYRMLRRWADEAGTSEPAVSSAG